MVLLIDLSWNQIESSLYIIYEKLVDLSFECADGEIRVINPETGWSKYHV